METSKLALALEQVAKHTKGEIELKITTVVPPPVDVKNIRLKTGMTQVEFANSYGFTASAIRNWEQSHRVPDGPSRILLALIERNPVEMKSEIMKLKLKAA